MAFPLGFLVRTFCTLVDLVSVIFFKLAAIATVLAIKTIRLPGVLVSQALEQVAQNFDSASGIIVEIGTEFVTSAVSSVCEILLDLITGTAGAANSVFFGLVEVTKGALQGLPESAGVLIQDLYELAYSVSCVWNNFVDAVSFVQEQAAD